MMLGLLAGCDNRGAAQTSTANGKSIEKVNKTMSENIQAPPASPAITDIKIEAKITQTDEMIGIRYSITNGSGKAIYVLDTYPGVDPQSHEAYAETKGFYLCKRGDDTAFVLRGIPPLPQFPVAVRVMPLGTKLEAGAHIEREFSIPTSLRERSDWYYAPATIEDHSLATVNKLAFSVQILRDTIEGFHAEPAPYAPEYFVVGGTSTVKQAESLNVGFDIKPTQLFIRRDIFTRL